MGPSSQVGKAGAVGGVPVCHREDAPGRRRHRPSGGSGCPHPPQLKAVRLCLQGRHDPDGRAVPVPAPHPGLVRRPAAGGAQPLTWSPPCPGPLPRAWGKGASRPGESPGAYLDTLEMGSCYAAPANCSIEGRQMSVVELGGSLYQKISESQGYI